MPAYKSLDWNRATCLFRCPCCGEIKFSWYIYYGIVGTGHDLCPRVKFTRAVNVESVKAKYREGGFGDWQMQRNFIGCSNREEATQVRDMIYVEINEDIRKAISKGKLQEFLDEFNSTVMERQ